MAGFGPIADLPIADVPSFAASDTIAESAGIADSISAGGTIPCDIAESMAITDAYTNTAAFVASLAETVAATDSYTGSATYSVALAESMAITDAYPGGRIFSLAIAETAAASDAYAARQGTVPAFPVDEGWWHYFYTELIVWMGYDPSNELLEIFFVDGTERTFSGVSFGAAQSFVTADDPDLYYNNAIKDRYTRVYA